MTHRRAISECSLGPFSTKINSRSSTSAVHHPVASTHTSLALSLSLSRSLSLSCYLRLSHPSWPVSAVSFVLCFCLTHPLQKVLNMSNSPRRSSSASGSSPRTSYTPRGLASTPRLSLSSTPRRTASANALNVQPAYRPLGVLQVRLSSFSFSLLVGFHKIQSKSNRRVC